MKYLLLSIFFCFSGMASAETSEDEKIIELAKTYKTYMMSNEPTKENLKDLKKEQKDDFKSTAAFVIQTISTNNSLLEKKFLTLPDEKTLQYLNFINEVFQNIVSDAPVNNSLALATAYKTAFSHNELVDNYYGMLFNAVGNKNKPFDLSGLDFKLKDYNLNTDAERGIFFLRCISTCNSQVWGYMNIAKPVNFSKAYDAIQHFPKFNGQPYYTFSDFDFEDFETVFDKTEGKELYKKNYLNKFYELLVYHYYTLRNGFGTSEELQKLVLGSIIRDKKYYQYTVYQENLKDLFYAVLQFNKRNIDCEDQWVAYPKDTSGVYKFGFIYIDEQAGLTYHYTGSFTITNGGALQLVENNILDGISLKARLEPSKKLLAIIPEEHFKELHVERYPSWLKYYKTDEDSIGRLFKWGFMYNGWDKPSKALTYLERAEKINPHFKGLAMELAFSYNALGQYSKAIAVLKSSPEVKEAPCYYYKELAYAQIRLDDLENAEATYSEASPRCDDAIQKAEIAYNITCQYYKVKNKAKFDFWVDEVRKGNLESRYRPSFDNMVQEMNH